MLFRSVIYGNTGTKDKSAKLIHGGGAFVWPIIQGVDYLSLRPFQVDCFLKGAISAQNIRVNVPTIITVAISTNQEVMQNAAERLLGRPHSEIEADVKDLAYGQMEGAFGYSLHHADANSGNRSMKRRHVHPEYDLLRANPRCDRLQTEKQIRND